MPILIVGFALGAYAFGSALRGGSIIVNEVGIVRGAPDATEGSAQVYLGVFSPARGTYQISVPGGALLSSPISGDVFGGQAASLDVIQGDPSRVRDLSVGFGSLRTIRAESQAVVPKVHAETVAGCYIPCKEPAENPSMDPELRSRLAENELLMSWRRAPTMALLPWPRRRLLAARLCR